jgi:uncharacterized protein YjiS (DUF1127 family)
LTGAAEASEEAQAVAEVLDEHEAAAFLRLSVHTLRSWRLRRRGPVYVRQGGRIAYLVEDLRAWLQQCRVGD